MPDFFSRRTDHPFSVNSLKDLPDDLRLLAEQKLNPSEQVDTIIVIPTQTLPRRIDGRGGMERVAPQVLLFTTQGIMVIQGDRKAISPDQITYLSADQLLYTRIILVLLYGHLEIFGVEQSIEKRITVRYNAARHDLIQPPLQRFLKAAWGKESQSDGQDKTKKILQQLEDQSYKFRNGLLIYALQPQEILSDFIFQPPIRQRILGFFTRLVAPAALLAFTDKNLITIEEGRTGATRYGWFINICPRANLAGSTIEPGKVGGNVCIHLKKVPVTVELRMMLGQQFLQPWQTLWSENVR